MPHWQGKTLNHRYSIVNLLVRGGLRLILVVMAIGMIFLGAKNLIVIHPTETAMVEGGAGWAGWETLSLGGSVAGLLEGKFRRDGGV